MVLFVLRGVFIQICRPTTYICCCVLFYFLPRESKLVQAFFLMFFCFPAPLLDSPEKMNQKNWQGVSTTGALFYGKVKPLPPAVGLLRRHCCRDGDDGVRCGGGGRDRTPRRTRSTSSTATCVRHGSTWSVPPLLEARLFVVCLFYVCMYVGSLLRVRSTFLRANLWYTCFYFVCL